MGKIKRSQNIYLAEGFSTWPCLLYLALLQLPGSNWKVYSKKRFVILSFFLLWRDFEAKFLGVPKKKKFLVAKFLGVPKKKKFFVASFFSAVFFFLQNIRFCWLIHFFWFASFLVFPLRIRCWQRGQREKRELEREQEKKKWTQHNKPPPSPFAKPKMLCMCVFVCVQPLWDIQILHSKFRFFSVKIPLFFRFFSAKFPLFFLNFRHVRQKKTTTTTRFNSQNAFFIVNSSQTRLWEIIKNLN